jgi:hypothetical protein
MSNHELTGDSAELIAYRLTRDIQELEGRFRQTGNPFSRQDYLDLYAECLEAVSNGRKIKDNYRSKPGASTNL